MTLTHSPMLLQVSDGMSSLIAEKCLRAWRTELAASQKEKQVLQANIDNMRQLYYEYDGWAEAAVLFASIVSVGKQMRLRLSIAEENIELATQRRSSFVIYLKKLSAEQASK
jgi:hypothetical protein